QPSPCKVARGFVTSALWCADAVHRRGADVSASMVGRPPSWSCPSTVRRSFRMLRVGPYFFKRAESTQEFEQVHRLNHRTFVDESPQNQPTGTGILVDKFHHKNVYLIVLRDERVVGMVSTHDQPPFSVADRLSNPEILYAASRPLEVRLLAIEPRERNNTLFF